MRNIQPNQNTRVKLNIQVEMPFKTSASVLINTDAKTLLLEIDNPSGIRTSQSNFTDNIVPQFSRIGVSGKSGSLDYIIEIEIDGISEVYDTGNINGDQVIFTELPAIKGRNIKFYITKDSGVGVTVNDSILITGAYLNYSG